MKNDALATLLLNMLTKPEKKSATARQSISISGGENDRHDTRLPITVQKAMPTADELSDIFERSSRRFDKHFELY